MGLFYILYNSTGLRVCLGLVQTYMAMLLSCSNACSLIPNHKFIKIDILNSIAFFKKAHSYFFFIFLFTFLCQKHFLSCLHHKRTVLLVN